MQKLSCQSIQKDAKERAARLIQQAEDVGYLSHKKSLLELSASNQSLSGLATILQAPTSHLLLVQDHVLPIGLC
jgi:hypothetical protein